MTSRLWLCGLLALGCVACDDDDNTSGAGGEGGGAIVDGGLGDLGQATPEELAACIGLSAGDACQIEAADGAVPGICSQSADGLACSATGEGVGGMDGAGGVGGMMGMGGMGGMMMSPPDEAFEACTGQAAGAECSFEGRMGNTVMGTCRDVPGGLVCAPDGMMGMGGMGGDGAGGAGGTMGPPPAALAACSELSAGDLCAFEARDGTEIAGACIDTDDGLACAPEGMMGMGGMGGDGMGGAGGAMMAPAEALAACADQMVDAACSFVTADGRMIEGACRDTPDGLACAPVMGGDGGVGGAMEGAGGAGGAMEGAGGAGGMMAPAEAAAACQDQAAGAACSFITPDGRMIDGACADTPDGLLCQGDAMAGAGGAMEGAGGAMEGAGGMMAPGEAIAACDGLDAGAMCAFEAPRDGRMIEGTCRNTPDGLACVPAR